MLIFLRFFFIISFPFLSSYQFYQAKVEQAIFHAYHDPASIFLTNRSEKLANPPRLVRLPRGGKRSVVRRVHRVKFSSPNLPLRYGEKRKDEYIEERVLSILHRYLGISSFLPRKKLLFKKKKKSTIPPCNFHVELTRDRFAISPYDFSNARRWYEVDLHEGRKEGEKRKRETEENEIMLWTVGRGGAKARSSVITCARTPFIKYLAYTRSKKYIYIPGIEIKISID